MQRITKKIGNHVVFPTELVGRTLLPDDPIMYRILTQLADYEDRRERAEKIMPLSDIERVLRDGEWLDETYWDYINWDCVPHDWAIELKRVADAVLELIDTTCCR